MKEKTIYSIVDIETTGGKGKFHKITEIAIYKFDGDKIIDEFQTLINPEKNIPQFITFLTGIDNQMVTDAPKFFEVAKKIVKFMKDTVFVAHNVFFDYNIIRREFSELGYTFKLPKLCTVRLARKYIPGHKSYSLGKICFDLNIPVTNRHRASGDAIATVELFKLILSIQENMNTELLNDIESADKLTLPAALSSKDIDSIPERIGIYYLKDDQGNILYIGKSTNIQKRIKSHFLPKLKKNKELHLKSKVAKIDHLCIPDELASLVIEAHEIKRLRPEFNRTLNRVNFRYAVVIKTVEERLILKTVKNDSKDYNQAFLYRSKKVAERSIESYYQRIFGCTPETPSFLKLQNILPLEDYNKRIKDFLSYYDYPASDFKIRTIGELKKEVIFNFKNNELKNISWDDHSFEINEDPDIKRIILKKIKSYQKSIILNVAKYPFIDRPHL